MVAGATLGRRKGRGLARLRAEPLRDRLRHPQQVLLGQPVDVAVVARVALDHAQAGAALTAALGALHALVVDRDAKALASLRVELGEVAAAGQRHSEDSLGQWRLDQGHAWPSAVGMSRRSRGGRSRASASSTIATIRSAVASRPS